MEHEQITRPPLLAACGQPTANDEGQQATALSASLQRSLEAVGISGERVQIIPNSMDVVSSAPPVPFGALESVLLFVGYLIGSKGVRYLLEAELAAGQRSACCQLSAAALFVLMAVVEHPTRKG